MIVGMAPIVTVAVRLSLVMRTDFVTLVAPAATTGKANRAGPFTDTAVPLPDRLMDAGAAPLYETDIGPDDGVGVSGENSTITAQFFLASTV